MENITKVSEGQAWYTAMMSADVVSAALWSLCTAYRSAGKGSEGAAHAWSTLQHELEPVIYGHPVPHVHTRDMT